MDITLPELPEQHEINEIERDADWLKPQMNLSSLLCVIVGIPTAHVVVWAVIFGNRSVRED